MTSPWKVTTDPGLVESTGQLSAIDWEQLIYFHQAHFPGAAVPDSHVASQQFDEEGEDDLGSYPDGVKRTLTNEQIKLLRHSEIQRLLAERRLGKDGKSDEKPQHRKRITKPTRPFRFDDEPKRNGNVDVLMYDDEEPAGGSVQKSGGERKFLWPTLGS